MILNLSRTPRRKSSHTQAATRLLIAKALNFDRAITERLQFSAAKPVRFCAALHRGFVSPAMLGLTYTVGCNAPPPSLKGISLDS